MLHRRWPDGRPSRAGSPRAANQRHRSEGAAHLQVMDPTALCSVITTLLEDYADGIRFAAAAATNSAGAVKAAIRLLAVIGAMEDT
ncbi:MAG: hypothetical protein OXQ29_20320 [Rhodospirillaceae bacterium]|nr:hypothetical protein [Rhodospirillaceae bacterium]